MIHVLPKTAECISDSSSSASPAKSHRRLRGVSFEFISRSTRPPIGGPRDLLIDVEPEVLSRIILYSSSRRPASYFYVLFSDLGYSRTSTSVTTFRIFIDKRIPRS